jgi:malonate decarboxylase beta subunit
MGDCNYLVHDTVAAFRAQLTELTELTIEEFEPLRRIGSEALVEKQLRGVALAVELAPTDSRDVWRYAGNNDPVGLADGPFADFCKTVQRLVL